VVDTKRVNAKRRASGGAEQVVADVSVPFGDYANSEIVGSIKGSAKRQRQPCIPRLPPMPISRSYLVHNVK
jgi:hypothetical protein